MVNRIVKWSVLPASLFTLVILSGHGYWSLPETTRINVPSTSYVGCNSGIELM